MRLQYAISIDDFRAIQIPFARRAGTSANFKGAIVVSSVLVAIGGYCLAEGMGLALAVLLIGLGGAVGIASYLYDVRSVRAAKQEYETNLLAAYQRLHCPGRRTVDWDNAGLTVTCWCGSVTRPWSDVAQISESPSFFQLRTKKENLVLPKSAFSGEGERTAFRRLVTEQLSDGRTFSSQAVEFVAERAEHRSARMLHILRGGGWRPFARPSIFLLVMAGALTILFGSRSRDTGERIVTVVLSAEFMLGIFVLAVLIFRTTAKRLVRVPVRLYFGEEGLHLCDPITISNATWESFCGYLENGSIFLLYHSSRLHRIIPKRALGSREAEFREILRRKVSPFDYHNPFRLGPREVAKGL